MKKYAFSIALALCSVGCQPRQFHNQAKPSQLAQGTLFDLISENSAASRENIAKQIDSWMASRPNGSEEKTRYMASILDVTRKALRNGALSLCHPEERITLFRGVGKVATTSEQKPFAPATGIYVHATIDQLLTAYATPPNGGESAGGPNISAWSYEALGSQHTLEGNAENSPFVSLSALAYMAASFGEQVFVVSMCPDRAFSTPEQAWAESEFLPLLGILPEEVVAVVPKEEAYALKDSSLAQCYAPDAGNGNRGDAKAVSGENFAKYNQFLLEKTIGMSQSPWQEQMNAFVSQDCACKNMVARKTAKSDSGFKYQDSECDPQ